MPSFLLPFPFRSCVHRLFCFHPLDDLVHLLTPHETYNSEYRQASRNTPEPDQIVDLLTGHFDVHLSSC